MKRPTQTPPAAFTLVEIMIVVVIIGLLATIAIPTFQRIAQQSRMTAFANDLRTLRSAVEIFNMESAVYPDDSSTGEFPAELAGYVNAHLFDHNTPLGGEWDIEYNDSGITSGVGVHIRPFRQSSIETLLLVDEQIDDGDSDEGSFQRLANDRYYWIIEP